MTKCQRSLLVVLVAITTVGSTGCATNPFNHCVWNGVVATPRVYIVAEGHPLFFLEPGSTFETPFFTDCSRPTVHNYADSERAGARRVRVHYPDEREPLYGILALCRTHEDFKGAASRSYRIEVPEERVEATDGGRMSFVTELYDIHNSSYPAWILWLSREPIPRQ